MIQVNHKPTKTDPNNYEIVGDSIDEIIKECLNRVRFQSKDFYKKELLADLKKHGKSHIDRHAGMGSYYEVWTQTNYSLTKLTKISQQLDLDY